MFLFALFRTFLQTGVAVCATLTDDDAPRKPAEPGSHIERTLYLIERMKEDSDTWKREKEALEKQIEELQKKLDVSAGATSEPIRINTELQEKLAFKTKELEDCEAALRSVGDGAARYFAQAGLKRLADDGAAVGGPAKRPRAHRSAALPEGVKIKELDMNLAKENYDKYITGNTGGWAELLQFLVTEKYGDKMVLTGDCRQTFGVQLSKLYKKWSQGQ